MAEEKLHWWYRWGLDELEARHWLGLVGLGFMLLSPFLALIRAESGLLAFVVGLIVLVMAAHATD